MFRNNLKTVYNVSTEKSLEYGSFPLSLLPKQQMKMREVKTVEAPLSPGILSLVYGGVQVIPN